MNALMAAACAAALCMAAVGGRVAVSSGYGAAYHTYGEYRGSRYSARALHLPPPASYYTPASYSAPGFGYYAPAASYPAPATSYSIPATGDSASTADSTAALDDPAALPSYSTLDMNSNVVPDAKVVQVQITMDVAEVPIPRGAGGEAAAAPVSSAGYIGYGSGVRSSDFARAGARERSGRPPPAAYSGYASGRRR